MLRFCCYFCCLCIETKKQSPHTTLSSVVTKSTWLLTYRFVVKLLMNSNLVSKRIDGLRMGIWAIIWFVVVLHIKTTAIKIKFIDCYTLVLCVLDGGPHISTVINPFKWHIQVEQTKKEKAKQKMHAVISAHMAMAIQMFRVTANRMNDDIDIDGFILRSDFCFFLFSILPFSRLLAIPFIHFEILAHTVECLKLYHPLIVHISWMYLRNENGESVESIRIIENPKQSNNNRKSEVQFTINISLHVVKKENMFSLYRNRWL